VVLAKKTVEAVREEVSTAVDEAEAGVRTLRKEMNRKPAATITSSNTHWIRARSHLDFQVTCWFSQMISPGSVWQATTLGVWPSRRYCGGDSGAQHEPLYGCNSLRHFCLSSILAKVTKYLIV
jgi:hypothetical protein